MSGVRERINASRSRNGLSVSATFDEAIIGRFGDDVAPSISSAISTTVSVSGRGTSVAAESCNGSPQNSPCFKNARDRLAGKTPPGDNPQAASL